MPGPWDAWVPVLPSPPHRSSSDLRGRTLTLAQQCSAPENKKGAARTASGCLGLAGSGTCPTRSEATLLAPPTPQCASLLGCSVRIQRTRTKQCHLKDRKSSRFISLPLTPSSPHKSDYNRLPEFLSFLSINSPTKLPINYYYKTCVYAGTQSVCMQARRWVAFQLLFLASSLQAASDGSRGPLLKGFTGSWVPHSWQETGPAGCAGGRSTRMGWSCPGPRSPLRSGIPARHPPGPQSRTAPAPTALAAGEEARRGAAEPAAGRAGLRGHHHTEEALRALAPRPRPLPAAPPEGCRAALQTRFSALGQPTADGGRTALSAQSLPRLGLGPTEMLFSKAPRGPLRTTLPTSMAFLFSSSDKWNGSVPKLMVLGASAAESSSISVIRATELRPLEPEPRNTRQME